MTRQVYSKAIHVCVHIHDHLPPDHVLGSFVAKKKSLVLNSPVHSNVRLMFSWSVSCTIQVFTSVLDCFSHQHLAKNSSAYNERVVRFDSVHLSLNLISSWSRGTRHCDNLLIFRVHLCKVIIFFPPHLIAWNLRKILKRINYLQL